MNSEVIDEGFSGFCNCIVTYILILVIKDQLVCCAKEILRRYCERSPSRSFGDFFKEWADEALAHPGRPGTLWLQFLGGRSSPWRWDGSCWDAFWPVRGHSDVQQNYYQRGSVTRGSWDILPTEYWGWCSYHILKKIIFWDLHERMSDLFAWNYISVFLKFHFP